MNSLTSKDYVNVYKNGNYYCPASSHYDQSPDECNVSCDRCKRSNLRSCIGWNEIDLCLQCNSEIEQISSRDLLGDDDDMMTLMMQDLFRPHTLTEMKQEQFRPQTLTRMVQEQFRPQQDARYEVITYMQQGQFRPQQEPRRGGGVRTNMMQRQFRPQQEPRGEMTMTMTNMMQRQFRPQQEPRGEMTMTMTNMMQRQFRPPQTLTKMRMRQFREKGDDENEKCQECGLGRREHEFATSSTKSSGYSLSHAFVQ